MKKITLVLGGIRSGKSYFGEQKVLFYSDNPVYIATSIPFDDEMKYRVEIHKARRKNNFSATYEEPVNLLKVFKNLENDTVCIVDCMTLNLSNRLLEKSELFDKKSKIGISDFISKDDKYLKDIFQIINKKNLNIVFISNEVGTSPVEMNKMGRYFQDLQGRWNRLIAEYSDEVYFVRAGIPQLIKKNSVKPFRVSAPSYLLPTGYVENVTYLIDKVDDIQLLLFDSTTDDELFQKDKYMISTLKYLTEETGKTFTVHMPTSPKIFDEKGFEKRLKNSLDMINLLSELKNIKSYTFHYDLPDNKIFEDLSSAQKEEIDNKYISLFEKILHKYPDIDISFENVSTPISTLDNVVKKCGISYCIDIGHLIFQNRKINEIEPRLHKTSIVHYHGTKKLESGKLKDHNEIVYDKKIFKILEKFHGILTIENYHKLKFEKSLKSLNEYY